MTKERKISDDELVEISGGGDGVIDIEPGLGTSRPGSGSSVGGGPVRIPGGSPDPETEGSGGSGKKDLF